MQTLACFFIRFFGSIVFLRIIFSTKLFELPCFCSVWSKTRAAGFNIAPQDAILLEGLKQRGFKLAILTNGPKDVQQIKVRNKLLSLECDKILIDLAAKKNTAF